MKIPREEFLRLSVAERIQLVGDIWDSIAEDTGDVPISEAQRAELDRRLAEYEQDPSNTKSWDEVRENLEREP